MMSQRARNYTILDGHLYKSGVVAPWLKCITIAEGRELLQKIHSGLWGSQIGVRPLVSKAFRQGFFWPSALKDAEYLVKTCESWQMMGVAEPPKLIRLKCANHHPKGNPG